MLVDSDPLAISRLLDDGSAAWADAPEQVGLPQRFKEGIEYLAGGVTVVTSSDDTGARFGLTTTSVCSLSTQPPAMVACIERSSKLGRDLGRTQRFCVNVLSSEQRSIAEAFAGACDAGATRFRNGTWVAGVTGSPVLANALVSFECTIDLLYGYPDHLIAVGGVQSVNRAPHGGDPLVSHPSAGHRSN